MSSVNDQLPTRYGCHECREDAERVLGNRATPGIRELYESHLRTCRDCRRMHRVLYAVYEGPAVPAPPSGVREEKAFYAVLRKMKEDTPEPWPRRWTLRAGVGVLAGSAAALTLSLFGWVPQDWHFLDEDPTEASIAWTSYPHDTGGRQSTRISDGSGSEGGIEHPAQSYGRVVGGHAIMLPPGDDRSANTDTFPVGTRFEVSEHDAVQLALVGKIVANFTPGTQIEWTVASPSLIEVKVDRGIAAFRYDRKPSDPILQVRTPSKLVRVVGTVFTVQVDDDDTWVSVLRGQVEVLQPGTNALEAEVESGHRYDSRRGMWDDVGRVEVAAAMPLSNDPDETGDPADAITLADGRIPSNWNVPGLSQNPDKRTLTYVPPRPGSAITAPTLRVTGTTGAPEEEEAAPEPERTHTARRVGDESEALIDSLMRDAEATRRKELHVSLEHCRALLSNPDTRYRAAKCLSRFISKYGDDAAAVEGYLLVGMLRMDYALDYRAAEVAFQTFLRRAPDHPKAELALYRMWLSSVEDGRISQALDRGRSYLRRHPHGAYVGKILQRFPELKSAL
jgi:hypothetical protein